MVSPHAESYIAIAILITMGTALFVEPRNGKLQKWIYWCFAPLIAITLLAIAFQSVLGGLGMGLIVILLLFGGYLRYKV
ncbi:hypothetical protein MSP7336_01385 [Mycobacterium shimoidei]|uniref:Uncharacterized protein n=1 Tax=Mycobacterium shimoidei TaxID=29313 RepID=A0A375YWS3_MYCSH|nr:hypothetical protein MSP7336_01385 [Mycobacterium shimoidei]